MQAKLICATSGLRLISDDSLVDFQEFLLTQGDGIIKKNFALDFEKILGIHSFSALRNNPYFFSNKTGQNHSELYEISNKSLATVQELIAFLWFVKDNSCNAHQLFAYLPEPEQVIFMDKVTNYSNCYGGFNEVQFSASEIVKAAKIMNAAKELSSANKYVKQQDYYKVENIDPNTTMTFVHKLSYGLRNRVERAILFLLTARQAAFKPMKISLYMNILECLFSDTSHGDIIHKISERAAFYIGDSFDSRMDIMRNIKNSYTLRSKYFHGQKIDHKDYSDVVLSDMAREIDGLMRAILTKVITVNHKEFTDSDKNLNVFFNKMIFGRD
ncbi:hypothetical protein [Mucilaginibacter sp.]|jgi:hypothetical protein|uniref:hypothetical protein n=1 Tax=Mucilaginibacter sp. TaxID=1882438 RepID=UPI002C874DA7|nr:hypothetical protein [Mucilaginibacter sp.]HTI57740.1 hypothetical protein [Mucilaginibacter sp.]